jgi:hypothetical protein
MRVEIRTTAADKARWQALAESRGLSLSDLVRALLDGQRRSPRPRRAPPPVEPALLRELARIGNNLNQLARAANRQAPVPAAALLVRLIEIDRELAALRRAHERPAEEREPGEADVGGPEAGASPREAAPAAPPKGADPAGLPPTGAVARARAQPRPWKR